MQLTREIFNLVFKLIKTKGKMIQRKTPQMIQYTECVINISSKSWSNRLKFSAVTKTHLNFFIRDGSINHCPSLIKPTSSRIFTRCPHYKTWWKIFLLWSDFCCTKQKGWVYTSMDIWTASSVYLSYWKQTFSKNKDSIVMFFLQLSRGMKNTIQDLRSNLIE